MLYWENLCPGIHMDATLTHLEVQRWTTNSALKEVKEEGEQPPQPTGPTGSIDNRSRHSKTPSDVLCQDPVRAVLAECGGPDQYEAGGYSRGWTVFLKHEFKKCIPNTKCNL